MDDHSPLEPDQLDELLSAELDGELDAAARDLGLSRSEVSERLRATPGVTERRRTLAAARELLGEPAEIDELTAARLRAAALATVERDATDTSPRRANRARHGRVFLGAGVAAASVLALVLVAAGLGGQSSEKSASVARPASGPASDNAKSESTAKKQVTTLPTAALGDFAQYDALAHAAVSLEGADRATSATAAPPGTGFAPAAAAATTSPDLDKQNASASSGANNALKSTRAAGGSTCTIPRPVPVGTASALQATATVSGKPVFVFVFTGKGLQVVVIEDTNCAVLNSQTLR